MEIGVDLWKASWLLALITMTQALGIADTLRITRYSNADLFAPVQEKNKACSETTCMERSSGTATFFSKEDLCTCKCHPQIPAFREDLKICVDDIHECPLAPFVAGSTSQQIPLVFLPLKGQIIHPSKEILFDGIHKPVCAVSAARFLTEEGWADLRNPLDQDVPFRLYRDEGRTYLQWVGESDLRNKISGRMVMVQLMCRELDEEPSMLGSMQEVFSPCVAFRIVGTPSRLQTNVTEVAFSLEATSGSNASDSDSLSVSEYVAIGICSVLLGLIYVASIFLYLHLKKRNVSKSSSDKGLGRDHDSIISVEEGVVKNNPLLSLTHHFGPPESSYSDTNSSDNEIAPDLIHQNHHDPQITSVVIHSQQRNNRFRSASPHSCYSSPSDSYQENSSFEKLPEENVSIVETLEDRPDHLRALAGTVRKKLYFNPAYFEPHMLIAPPPAALEFLAKIREVISIAKQKMASKKFSPSLLNIPEEETNNYSVEPSYKGFSSRRESVISLKRKNSRRKSCTGCPGCEPQEFIRSTCGKLPEFPVLGACQNCTTSNDSKQHSIRKWLEDVPVLRVHEHCGPASLSSLRSPKRLRSPTRSLPPESISSDRALSPRPASEKAVFISSHKIQPKKAAPKPPTIKDKRIHKPKSPPPPIPIVTQKKAEYFYDTVPVEGRRNLPPPDMIQQAIELESHQAEETTRIPTLTKKQMNAVINELTVHKNMLEAANRELARRANAGYDTDSLERNKNKGYSTPSDYQDVSPSQASPSLSTALPVDEEITIQNAIFNKQTGNMTISKLNMDEEGEHDYELVVLKNGALRNYELLKEGASGRYSLVSEVYVNNGYDCGSNASSRSESNCSTLERRTLKVRYDGGFEKPGKLLIEVEDCLDHYIPVNDSDEFEPDTLDRPNKYAKLSIADENNSNNNSLDQILLRSNGSFKNQMLDVNANNVEISNFNRVFGSLRELYEEKRKQAREKEHFSLESSNMETDDEGKLLTLEERHSRRQRVKTTSTGPVIPPDLIPPPPHDGAPIYEHPKPPRKVLNPESLIIMKTPPQHPKNESNRSVNNVPEVGTPESYKLCLLQKSKSNGLVTDLIQTEDLILKKNAFDQFVFHAAVNDLSPFPVPVKTVQSMTNNGKSPKVFLRNKNRRNWQPDDSGYLSTDSNESKLAKLSLLDGKQQYHQEQNGSETDESLGDGHSESGAESVETHSVFFGRFRSRNPSMGGYSTSMDSGVMNGEEGHSSSDSETVSYTTVVPVSSSNNSLVMR